MIIIAFAKACNQTRGMRNMYTIAVAEVLHADADNTDHACLMLACSQDNHACTSTHHSSSVLHGTCCRTSSTSNLLLDMAVGYVVCLERALYLSMLVI